MYLSVTVILHGIGVPLYVFFSRGDVLEKGPILLCLSDGFSYGLAYRHRRRFCCSCHLIVMHVSTVRPFTIVILVIAGVISAYYCRPPRKYLQAYSNIAAREQEN